MWAKKKTLFLKKANKKRFPHKISTKPPPLTYNTKMFRKNEKTKQKSIFASSWFHDKNKNIWTYTYAYIWLNIGMKNRAISFCMSQKNDTWIKKNSPWYILSHPDFSCIFWSWVFCNVDIKVIHQISFLWAKICFVFFLKKKTFFFEQCLQLTN